LFKKFFVGIDEDQKKLALMMIFYDCLRFQYQQAQYLDWFPDELQLEVATTRWTDADIKANYQVLVQTGNSIINKLDFKPQLSKTRAILSIIGGAFLILLGVSFLALTTIVPILAPAWLAAAAVTTATMSLLSAAFTSVVIPFIAWQFLIKAPCKAMGWWPDNNYGKVAMKLVRKEKKDSLDKGLEVDGEQFDFVKGGEENKEEDKTVMNGAILAGRKDESVKNKGAEAKKRVDEFERLSDDKIGESLLGDDD
jgi:hypothetical protein